MTMRIPEIDDGLLWASGTGLAQPSFRGPLRHMPTQLRIRRNHRSERNASAAPAA